ncbi:MAG TPA: LysM domain-containing protein [Conexibacter sp.]|nr:LysM domain-containing protein [Conexibacter sp.]
MADRNPARLAAPLALLAAAVAVVVVVASSRSDPPSSMPSSATRTTVTQPARQTRRAAPKAYVVKAGDTLTVIADRTGVSLDEIERLNPDVDANALQTGERLRLSP